MPFVYGQARKTGVLRGCDSFCLWPHQCVASRGTKKCPIDSYGKLTESGAENERSKKIDLYLLKCFLRCCLWLLECRGMFDLVEFRHLKYIAAIAETMNNPAASSGVSQNSAR